MHEELDGHTASAEPKTAHGGVLHLDIERYRHHLQTSGRSEQQITETLTMLWTVITAFVDLGFGVDSAHLALRHSQQPPSPTQDNAQ